MWVCDFHHIVVEQLQVAVRVNNGLVTTSAPGCFGNEEIFLVRVVQILFYDVQNRRKVYNVCCHYNDLVQKVTLKCLNNTSFVN